MRNTHPSARAASVITGRWGTGETPPGFFARENGNRLCFMMIETPGALAEVDAIAALDMVDGLFAGPSDLSMTRGRGPFVASDDDLADLGRVAAAASARGKRFALPAPGARMFEFARRQRAAFVTVSDDLTALRLGFAKGLTVVGGH